MIAARVIAAIIGYVCGLFTTGYFLGKLHQVDLHNEGSGNIGMTNAMRILGKKVGALTLLGDFLKVVVAFLIVGLIFKNRFPEDIYVLQFYAATFALFGHVFPVTMKFKGGKGIACGLGLIATCFPILLLPIVAVFILCVLLSRTISLGSVVAAALTIVGVFIESLMGLLPVEGSGRYEILIWITVVLLVVIVRHTDNIKRLLAGTENTLSFGKKKSG